MASELRVTAVGASGHLGGTEQVLLDLATHADDLGIALRVLVPIDGPLIKALSKHGVTAGVVDAPKRLLRASQREGHLWTAVPALLGLHRWAKRLKNHEFVSTADLVYTISYKPHLAAAMGGLKPVVWHLHEFPPASTGRIWRFMAHRSPRHMIANSDAVADAWRSSATVPTDRITVVHNGVDLNRFCPRPATKWIHDALGIPHERRLIGMPAVLARWKGQLEVEEAFGMIADDFPNADLVFVGGAIYDTVAEREYGGEIERLVSDRVPGSGVRGPESTSSRVHLLPFQEEIERVYSEFDLTVHYSLRPEAFGKVIVESMACGVPIIAADEGGPREILGSKPEGGWLVEPRDPLALAAAMRDALRHDTGDLREIGNRGRERVEEAFSSTRFAAELASVFQRVCGAARARPAR